MYSKTVNVNHNKTINHKNQIIIITLGDHCYFFMTSCDILLFDQSGVNIVPDDLRPIKSTMLLVKKPNLWYVIHSSGWCHEKPGEMRVTFQDAIPEYTTTVFSNGFYQQSSQETIYYLPPYCPCALTEIRQWVRTSYKDAIPITWPASFWRLQVSWLGRW